MIKHLLKLVWNRKRANALLLLEIFFSFVVVFLVAALAVYYADNYSRPLGFDYDEVWNIYISTGAVTDDVWTEDMVHTTRQLFLAVQDFPEVEAVAGALSSPYGIGSRASIFDNFNGKRLEMEINEVTDDFAKVLNLQLVAGRWFEAGDDALNWQPVVLNQMLAQELYGTEDPIGKAFEPWSRDGVDARVIGVITAFRKGGEFEGPGNYLFERKKLNDVKNRPPHNLLLKLRPGTTAEFEEKLVTKLQAVAKTWSFEILPLTRMREIAFKFRLVPLFVLGLIGGFLMLMVMLGLVGVLWQNVTQRMKEIGLRRAKGAAGSDIQKQILGELLLLTSMGLIIGVIIAVQFPLLNLVSFVSTKVYLLALALALAVIYGLTTLAGLYPSWLATRVQPAEALHYE
jgi:putative ABC transport system permease protein